LIDDVDAPTTSHTSELIELLLHRGAGFKSQIQIRAIADRRRYRVKGTDAPAR